MRGDKGCNQAGRLRWWGRLVCMAVGVIACGANAEKIPPWQNHACCHSTTGDCVEIPYYQGCGGVYIWHQYEDCLGDEACLISGDGCVDVDALCCPDLGGDPMGPGTECGDDCNGNGIDDECDIDYSANCGTSDCPLSCTPTGCDATVCNAEFDGSSGQLGPVGGENPIPLVYVITNAPYTVDDVEIDLTAKAELGGDHVFVVYANGYYVGTAFYSSGSDCPSTPD
ncbi:MAG: hypothetical protein PVI86_11005, partial [Phycisphaerae bacterium]